MADGHVVYQGIANRAVRYFQGAQFDINIMSNPADIFMKIISVNYPKEDADTKKLNHLNEYYKENCEPGVLKSMQSSSMVDFKPRRDNFSEPSFCIQLKLLMKR